MITKLSRPPSLCHQCIPAVFLGLINTCCNRNVPTLPPHLKMMKMICRYNGVYCLVECIMSGTKNLTHHIQGTLLFSCLYVDTFQK